MVVVWVSGLMLFTMPVDALVEPEVEGWQDLVRAVAEVSQAPGLEIFPEALGELGGLGAALASAPLHEFMVELEQRRGLEFQYFTPWHVKDKDELRVWLQSQLAKEYGPEKIEQTEATLKVLGLVSADFSFLPFMENLLTGQVGGAYDPEADQFFLVDIKAGRSVRETLRDSAFAQAGLDASAQMSVLMIHELDHALGGQHFALKKLLDSAVDWSTDRQMAAQALIEGEATFVMTDHQKAFPPEEMGEKLQFAGAEQIVSMTLDMLASSPITLPGTAGLDEAPLYFQKSLLGSYMYGAEFVSTLRHQANDWSAVNAVYSALPNSTEQIFHPFDYLYVASEPRIPNFSTLPTTLGPWKKVVDDTGGEFLVRIVLEQYGVPNYIEAAGGWDGDRLRVYRHQKSQALAFVWAIRWDASQDSDLFRQAAEASLPFQLRTGDKWTLLSSGFSAAELRRVQSALTPTL